MPDPLFFTSHVELFFFFLLLYPLSFSPLRLINTMKQKGRLNKRKINNKSHVIDVELFPLFFAASLSSFQVSFSALLSM